MLPAKFSPTGDYSERIRDRARGFRVLAHAEIEAYLEGVANEIIDNKIDAWKLGKANHVMISFLASYHAGWATDENDKPIFYPKNGVKKQKTVLEAVDKASAQYKSEIIGKNNGVKIACLQELFIPLGVDFDAVDSTWLASIESFGKQRGETAHQAKKTQKATDPKNELDTVTVVMDGLKDFDRALAGIMAS